MALQSIEFLNARSLRTYGCEYGVALDLNGSKRLHERGSKAHRYGHQRAAAKLRGIAWEISFPEWVRVWMESGHWEQRGCGVNDYCMARHGDVGAYRVDNVSIQLARENSQFAWSHVVFSQGHSRTGRGKGWSPGRDGKFQSSLFRKNLGLFNTKEEAIAAYQAALAEFRLANPGYFMPHESREIRGARTRAR